MRFWRERTRSERVTALMLLGAAVCLALAFGLPREADPEAIGEWDALALAALLALLVWLAVFLAPVMACLTRDHRVHERGWRDLLDRFLPISAWTLIATSILL